MLLEQCQWFTYLKKLNGKHWASNGNEYESMAEYI